MLNVFYCLCCEFYVVNNMYKCCKCGIDNIVVEIRDYIKNLYICSILLNVNVWILAKIDFSTRIADSSIVTLFTFATKIMCWPVTTCVPFKVIIKPGGME